MDIIERSEFNMAASVKNIPKLRAIYCILIFFCPDNEGRSSRRYINK